MVPLLSSTTIGGIPLRYFIETSDLDVREIIQRLRNAGKTIIKKKGATEFGPSYAISNLIMTIVRDHHKVLSVSTYLNGEIEGVKGVSLGVPAIISRHGVKMIIKINMHNIEKAEFLAAAKTIRQRGKRENQSGNCKQGKLSFREKQRILQNGQGKHLKQKGNREVHGKLQSI